MSQSVTSRSPATVLAEEIASLQQKNQEFARQLGITPPHLSMILKGKRSITPRMCQILGKITRYKENEWLEMLEHHKQAQQEEAKVAVPPGVAACLSAAGIKKAIELGWLEVSPFDENTFLGSCILLTPGQEVRLQRTDGSVTSHLLEDGVKLLPGELAMFESSQEIRLNSRLTSIMDAVEDLTLEGILLFGSAPDSDYRGRIRLSLKNLGFGAFELTELPVARLRLIMTGEPEGGMKKLTVRSQSPAAHFPPPQRGYRVP